MLVTYQFTYAQTDSISPGKSDSLLIVELRTNYYPSSPKNYNAARDSMYNWLDVDATDSLTCVYSGLRAKRDGTRTPANGAQEFNTEHSWPQSFYDEAEPMRGDIHHLFPTWSSPNSSRGNHPFAEIDDNLTTSWWFWENGSSVSSIPSSNINAYSEYYNDTFEPREDHKGNVARAMFYFWTMYQTNSDVINDTQDNNAFFDGMKSTLYEWHQQDPVDSAEVTRSLEVESVQGNRNPFIHDTTLVRRAYFTTSSSSSDTIPDVYISEVYEANGGTVKYVELFNYSGSSIDLSSGSYELLRYSNAGTSPTSISLTGTIASKSFYVVGDDNASSGVQTVFDEGVVDQNTSSINHNGNDKYVLIRSSSDTLDSFSKDNIGNSSTFSSNQVAYRIFSALPNDGSFNQTANSSDGDTVSSGFWRVFNLTSSNANANLVATPGYSSGIESDQKPQALITGNAGWRMISIPGNSATLEQISDDTAIQGIDDANDSNVFTFESTGSYSSPDNTSSTLTNGEGLLVYFFDNDNNGSESLPIVLDTSLDEPGSDVSVSLNTTTSTSSSYFTLIGNPFQSNFDVSGITFDNSLQTNIHILNDGLYEAIARSSTIIKPWQAFWVESSTGSAATQVTFPTSSKTSSSATSSAFSKINPEEGRVQFSLISSETVDQGCELVFDHHSTTEWDINDSSKLSPTRQNYSILFCGFQGNQQSILSLPITLDKEIKVPVYIESVGLEPGHSIDWERSSFLDEHFEFLLTDTDRDEEILLGESGMYNFDFISSKEKTSGFYQVGPTLKSLVDIPRFELTIRPKGVTVHSDNSDGSGIPDEFELKQNYPNPFNPVTTIEYSIPVDGNVDVEIFSILGTSIEKIKEDEFHSRGNHRVLWDASKYPSGVYFAELRYSGESRLMKMLLIK